MCYVKPKYGKKENLYYMDTDSFVVHVKTDDIYKDIVEDVEKRFDTSSFELDRPLPKGKNKKVVRLMKDKSSKKSQKIIFWIESKNMYYLKGKNDEDKKAKSTKECVIKRKIQFKSYKKMFRSNST